MKEGVTVEAETKGMGKVAKRGRMVSIRYSGFLDKGDAFQKEATRQFRLGQREVISGLEYAVEGMNVGGRRKVRINPELAYYNHGFPGVIPPDAVLIFDIELIAVED